MIAVILIIIAIAAAVFLALFAVFAVVITISRAINMGRHERASRAAGVPSGPYVSSRDMRHARQNSRRNAAIQEAAKRVAEAEARAIEAHVTAAQRLAANYAPARHFRNRK